MKKYIYTILLSAFCMNFFTSCDSLLEEVNYGNPTAEDMMSDEANVILLVGQAYAETKWLHDHWGFFGVSSLTSDECVCPERMPGEHWSDGGYWRNLNTHRWTEQASAFKNIWDSTISGAVLCNKLLATLADNKESMSEDIYNQYIGELEVLRSYYYYMLFDCFGRIPYLEEFVDRSEPLMEPYNVWSHLVACLERNAPNMAVVNDANRSANYGRATQGFTYGLLARLYLNAESFGCTPENIDKTLVPGINSSADFYTNAIRCCDKVIEAGSYSIEDDYFTNFKIDNAASRENIFVIVEDGSAEFDKREMGSMSNKLRVNILTLHYSMQDTWGMVEKPWNGFCARPTYIDRFAASDVRGPGNEGKGTNNEKQWGWFIGNIYDKTGTTIAKDENGDPAVIRKEIESLDAANWWDGARLFKYEVDREGKYAYSENDFVLMRYADILWMKEEAILRGGNGTSGVNSDDFKKMQSRAFAYDANPAAAYQAAYPTVMTLEGIIDERGREFSWELVRRRDLIRFGKYNDPKYLQYVENTDPSRNWFPIPYSVLEKSVRDENGNPLWTQNPGY